MKYSCGLTTQMKTTEQYFAVRCSLLQVLCYVFFFLWIYFQFFSRFFCFPFSLPFFSLYLLPFNIPFLSTGKVLASALLKTWKSNIHDQLGYLAYFTTIFAPKIGNVFSGIALPEFGRYSKWTHVWMDLPLLC